MTFLILRQHSIAISFPSGKQKNIMPDPWEEARHPQEAKEHFLRYLRNEALQLNFYRAHMLYFVTCIAIASIIVYGEGLANDPGSQNGTRLRYIDALFLCCSAMTTTGRLEAR